MAQPCDSLRKNRCVLIRPLQHWTDKHKSESFHFYSVSTNTFMWDISLLRVYKVRSLYKSKSAIWTVLNTKSVLDTLCETGDAYYILFLILKGNYQNYSASVCSVLPVFLSERGFSTIRWTDSFWQNYWQGWSYIFTSVVTLPFVTDIGIFSQTPIRSLGMVCQWCFHLASFCQFAEVRLGMLLTSGWTKAGQPILNACYYKSHTHLSIVNHILWLYTKHSWIRRQT